MESFQDLIRQGAAHAWLFVPSAILLGALHGLERGHSKTMMAAFIVAIRGTMAQAVLLGLSATVSHTAVVWAVALLGLYFGSRWDPETSEQYLQVASAVLIGCWRAHGVTSSASGRWPGITTTPTTTIIITMTIVAGTTITIMAWMSAHRASRMLMSASTPPPFADALPIAMSPPARSSPSASPAG